MPNCQTSILFMVGKDSKTAYNSNGKIAGGNPYLVGKISFCCLLSDYNVQEMYP